MNKPLEERIRDFAGDEANIQQALALLKVGQEKGHAPQRSVAILLADALLRFHGVTTVPPGQN